MIVDCFINNVQPPASITTGVCTVWEALCAAHECVKDLVDANLLSLTIAKQHHEVENNFALSKLFTLQIIFQSGKLSLNHSHPMLRQLTNRSRLAI